MRETAVSECLDVWPALWECSVTLLPIPAAVSLTMLP